MSSADQSAAAAAAAAAAAYDSGAYDGTDSTHDASAAPAQAIPGDATYEEDYTTYDSTYEDLGDGAAAMLDNDAAAAGSAGATADDGAHAAMDGGDPDQDLDDAAAADGGAAAAAGGLSRRGSVAAAGPRPDLHAAPFYGRRQQGIVRFFRAAAPRPGAPSNAPVGGFGFITVSAEQEEHDRAFSAHTAAGTAAAEAAAAAGTELPAAPSLAGQDIYFTARDVALARGGAAGERRFVDPSTLVGLRVSFIPCLSQAQSQGNADGQQQSTKASDGNEPPTFCARLIELRLQVKPHPSHMFTHALQRLARNPALRIGWVSHWDPVRRRGAIAADPSDVVSVRHSVAAGALNARAAVLVATPGFTAFAASGEPATAETLARALHEALLPPHKHIMLLGEQIYSQAASQHAACVREGAAVEFELAPPNGAGGKALVSAAALSEFVRAVAAGEHDNAGLERLRAQGQQQQGQHGHGQGGARVPLLLSARVTMAGGSMVTADGNGYVARTCIDEDPRWVGRSIGQNNNNSMGGNMGMGRGQGGFQQQQQQQRGGFGGGNMNTGFGQQQQQQQQQQPRNAFGGRQSHSSHTQSFSGRAMTRGGGFDRASQACGASNPALVRPMVLSGVVKSYAAQKQYGFITPNGDDAAVFGLPRLATSGDGGSGQEFADLFVHSTAITAAGFNVLVPGQAVEFAVEAKPAQQGGGLTYRAVGVTGPGCTFLGEAPMAAGGGAHGHSHGHSHGHQGQGHQGHQGHGHGHQGHGQGQGQGQGQFRGHNQQQQQQQQQPQQQFRQGGFQSHGPQSQFNNNNNNNNMTANNAYNQSFNQSYNQNIAQQQQKQFGGARTNSFSNNTNAAVAPGVMSALPAAAAGGGVAAPVAALGIDSNSIAAALAVLAASGLLSQSQAAAAGVALPQQQQQLHPQQLMQLPARQQPQPQQQQQQQGQGQMGGAFGRSHSQPQQQQQQAQMGGGSSQTVSMQSLSHSRYPISGPSSPGFGGSSSGGSRKRSSMGSNYNNDGGFNNDNDDNNNNVNDDDNAAGSAHNVFGGSGGGSSSGSKGAPSRAHSHPNYQLYNAGVAQGLSQGQSQGQAAHSGGRGSLFVVKRAAMGANTHTGAVAHGHGNDDDDNVNAAGDGDYEDDGRESGSGNGNAFYEGADGDMQQQHQQQQYGNSSSGSGGYHQQQRGHRGHQGQGHGQGQGGRGRFPHRGGRGFNNRSNNNNNY